MEKLSPTIIQRTQTSIYSDLDLDLEDIVGDITEEVNKAELRKALKFMKKGEAAEPGGIPIQLVQLGQNY